MEPFTPKARSRLRKDKLTLSAKQYSKITTTIASVRRSRLGDIGNDEIDYLETKEPSFIAEKSFKSAPLNSRVPVQSPSATRKGKQKVEALDKVPLEVQEPLILEDLLFVLMGIEGTYITYSEGTSLDDPDGESDPLTGARFVVCPTLDASLRDLVERVLSLATYYTAISAFIQARSHLSFGLVNHALCASIRSMLSDYHTLLAQLEHAFHHSPSFSLQKLFFYVHPTLGTLSHIYGLICEIVDAEVEEDDDEESNEGEESEDDPEEAARNEALGLGGAKLKALVTNLKKSRRGDGANDVPAGPAKGGEVLAIVYDRLQRLSGDPSALALHRALLHSAGRPYALMLVAWTRQGTLRDPYDEFCVKEARFIDKSGLDADYTDEYWERRYTLRDGSSGTDENIGGKKTMAMSMQAGIPSARTPGGRLPGGACIPPQLESWKHKVLLAGKYLNVLQECGREIKRTIETDEDEYAMEGDKFYKSIDAAYAFANDTLVHVLLHDQKLLPRLRSLKHYFFLSQSAFLTHFLDAAHNELRKASRSASKSRLQSLLDVALNGESCPRFSDRSDVSSKEEEETYREDVKVDMASTGLYEWLMKIVSVSGVIGDETGGAGGEKDKEKDEKEKSKLLASDALMLDYNVKFPLSLVISRKTIVRYQLIFRFLLHLRIVEQSLLSMWCDQTAAIWRSSKRSTTPSSTSAPELKGRANGSKPSSGRTTPKETPKADSDYPELDQWRRAVFLLRARMLAFVQQLLAFVTYQVLEPNWRRLENTLGIGSSKGKVSTVDALLRAHVDFLDTCLKECMLTSARLIKTFEKLINTISTFALYSAHFTKSLSNAVSTVEGAGVESDQGAMAKRWDFLRKFETNYEHWFNSHLDCVQYYASSENGALLPLVTRLVSIKNTNAPGKGLPGIS